MRRDIRARTLIGLAVISVGLATIAGTSPAKEPDEFSCSDKGAVIGTDGNDRLEGTKGHDLICGLGGDDKIITRLDPSPAPRQDRGHLPMVRRSHLS